MQTLSDLTSDFRKVYGLLPSNQGGSLDTRHDGIHAMTGFGIGGANELRVYIVILAMAGESLDWVRHEHARKVTEYKNFYNKLCAKEYIPVNSPSGAFEDEKFWFAQRHMDGLAEGEVAALYQLGRKMGDRVEQLTGGRYFKTRKSRLDILPFEQVDFRAEALGISSVFRSAKNRRVDRVSDNALAAKARALSGASLIPHDKLGR